MQDLLEEMGLKNTDIQGTLSRVATLDNARQWARESEQFIFCIDLLEMSAHDDQADWAVNTLEDRFAALLAEHPDNQSATN